MIAQGSPYVDSVHDSTRFLREAAAVSSDINITRRDEHVTGRLTITVEPNLH